jgi:hypothetical protein
MTATTDKGPKIEMTDGVILDRLLKEHGTSRDDFQQKIGQEILDTRERVKKEADDKRERDRLKEVTEKETKALKAYNERMIATIDGKTIGPKEDLREPPCPRCGAALDFLKDCIIAMTNEIHRSSDPFDRGMIGGSFVAIFNPLPMLKGTFKCRNCDMIDPKHSHVLELVIETTPPRKTKDGETSH